MKVSQNSFVKKGDIIAKAIDRPREQRLKLLERNLKLQEKATQLQENNIKTAKDKYKMGIGPKNSYLTQEIKSAQLKKQYNTTKNDYNTLKLKQKNSIIYAPKSGILTNVLADNFYINYGSKIATLLENDNLIKLFVNSSYVQYIDKNMDVKIFSSYKNCNAKVVDVLPKSVNNLIEVIVKTKESLPLNLQVDAKIIIKYSDGALIPKDAIVLVDNHPAIYQIDDKNIAHLVFVEIVKDMIDKALIKNTLNEDAKIALKNAYMLHDNLGVSIK